jgi:hypothetical protein
MEAPSVPMVSIDVITNEVINELMNGVINDVRMIRNESSMLPAEKNCFISLLVDNHH